MAQQSARRGRKNQGFPPCHEHAVGDVVPVRELPYGPAAPSAASEAGQMAASDYVPNTQIYRLRLLGRPQMESGNLAAPMDGSRRVRCRSSEMGWRFYVGTGLPELSVQRC